MLRDFGKEFLLDIGQVGISRKIGKTRAHHLPLLLFGCLDFYFSFFDKGRFSITFLFFVGLIFDSLQGMPFGMTSICFILLSILAAYLKQRRTQINFQNEFIAFAISLFVTQVVSVIILNYYSPIPFEYLLLAINIIVSLVFYPVIRTLLKVFYHY